MDGYLERLQGIKSNMATDYQQYESKVIELARFILAILIVVRHSAYSEIISGGGV